uniref:Uncharacterized protein n=1 Tax=Arundo donax TaxID=35708 RepID=A0A0A9FB43_ARUDO
MYILHVFKVYLAAQVLLHQQTFQEHPLDHPRNTPQHRSHAADRPGKLSSGTASKRLRRWWPMLKKNDGDGSIRLGNLRNRPGSLARQVPAISSELLQAWLQQGGAGAVGKSSSSRELSGSQKWLPAWEMVENV